MGGLEKVWGPDDYAATAAAATAHPDYVAARGRSYKGQHHQNGFRSSVTDITADIAHAAKVRAQVRELFPNGGAK